VTDALVSLDDIRAAADRIRGIAVRTPLLDVRLGLKCENFQPGGAFKIRGACNMITQLLALSEPLDSARGESNGVALSEPLDSARGESNGVALSEPLDSVRGESKGVITYSSGNHGLAVALVASVKGIRAVIVMPENAPRVKVDRVRQYGAEVITAGTTSADRKTRAEAEAGARGLTIVPPFDHPWIIAGAGTVGLEIMEQRPQAKVIYVPMGGGGQISGVSAAVKRMRDGIRVVGVEPAGAARMSASLAAGHAVTLERASSIADGLLTLRPGDVTFAHVRAFVDEVVTVDDAEMIAAVKWLFHEARIVAEPSGAAAVAAALRAGEADAVAVVSGGNVDPSAYASYIADSS
jgi:threonine dehydratase